jgi:LysM repeat protein
MKTANEAVEAMRKHYQLDSRGFAGWCLKTVRTAWGLPATQVSAISAWKSIPASKKHTNPAEAPIGAPHFFDIGKFGHVVMQSDFVGQVWGVDAPAHDKVGKVNLSWFQKNWGKNCKYLGWSTHLNGKDLPLKQMPKNTLKSMIVGVPLVASPAKNPVAYDVKAAATGGGVDTLKPTTKPAKKSVVVPAKTYTVKKGDTLWEIAKAKGTTVTALRKLNGIKGDTITIGSKLKLK